MNMSEYGSGVIKLNNGPNGQVKSLKFSWLDFGLQMPWNALNEPPRGSQTPG